jgi:hypothetical protein
MLSHIVIEGVLDQTKHDLNLINMECFSGPTNPKEFDHLKLDLRVVLPHVIPSSSRFRLHVCSTSRLSTLSRIPLALSLIDHVW